MGTRLTGTHDLMRKALSWFWTSLIGYLVFPMFFNVFIEKRMGRPGYKAGSGL